MPEMIPIFPPEEILEIEAHWSKKALQKMALEYYIDPHGGKDDLIEKLIYVGAMNEDGKATGKTVEELRQRVVPFTVQPAGRRFQYHKRYLVNSHDRLIYPKPFNTAYEADQYRKLERMARYQAILFGYEAESLLGKGYREAELIQRPGTNGSKAAPSCKKLKTVPYTVPIVGPKFDMGKVVMTVGVAAEVESSDLFAQFVMSSLRRHGYGDWGDVPDQDKKSNDACLTQGCRLFSAYEPMKAPDAKYRKPELRKIWIITEADRSATTILFPDEY